MNILRQLVILIMPNAVLIFKLTFFSITFLPATLCPDLQFLWKSVIIIPQSSVYLLNWFQIISINPHQEIHNYRFPKGPTVQLVKLNVDCKIEDVNLFGNWQKDFVLSGHIWSSRFGRNILENFERLELP